MNADVVVANNLSKVFVAPLTAGYGQVQEVDVRNVSSLNFRGVAFPQAATVTRAAADEIPQILVQSAAFINYLFLIKMTK